MPCDNLEGQDGEEGGTKVQEGGDRPIPTADSCSYIAEANTILESNHPSTKKKKEYCIQIAKLSFKNEDGGSLVA